MLKKILLTITALAFVLGTTKAQDTKEFIKKGIQSLNNTEEIRKILEGQVKAIEMFESILSLGDLKITSGDDDRQKEEDEYPRAIEIPTEINTDTLKARLREQLKGNYLWQDLTPPQSSFFIDSPSSYGSDDIVGTLLPNLDSHITYTIHKTFYANGIVKDSTYRILLNEYTKLDNAYFIDSMQVDLIAKFPTIVKRLSASVDNLTVGTENDTVKIISLKGREADMLLSPYIYNNLIAIQALDKEGRKMDTSSRNTSSTPTPEMITYFTKIGEESKTIIGNMDNKQYASIDDLKKDMTERFTSIDPPAGILDYTMWVQFPNQIKQIDIYYGAALDSMSVAETLVNKDIQPSPYHYYLTTDRDTYKRGIIDSWGKPVIEPQYDGLDHFDKLFFRGYLSNDDDTYQTFKLDPETKTLSPYKYLINELISGNYLISEKGDQDKKGVMDRNENIIIPIAYDWINSPEEGFIIAGSDKYDLYNSFGKKLLPESYDELNVSNGYVYTVQYNNDDTRNSAIFDSNMQQITKNNWVVENHFSGDTPLALITEKDKRFYINPKGEIVIPSSDIYVYDNRFDDGATIIYEIDSDGNYKYGYMDESGKIIIDCQYDDAGPFTEGYAQVRKDGKRMLITKNNQIYRTFTDSSEWE